MHDAKKQMVSLIVNKAKGPTNIDNLKPPEAEMPEMKDGVPQDESVPRDTAAEELLSAIEMKSPKAIVEALEALMELLKNK